MSVSGIVAVMETFKTGAKSVLARAVSAELRAYMAARRISGNWLASEAGMSQNYLATRLRDEKPFTLDDIERITRALDMDIDPQVFIVRAMDRNAEDVWMSAEGYTLAASDADLEAEEEAQQQEP